MKRKLTKQMLAEWRSNIWLFIELLVVSLVLWWINDYFFIIGKLRSASYGYDTTDVYRIDYSWYFQNLPPDADIQSLGNAQLDEIMNRLRAEPGVESACLSAGMMIYSQGCVSSLITLADDSTLYIATEGFSLPRYGIDGRGDICKTLGIYGVNGETPAQLDELLKQGKMLVTDNVESLDKEGKALTDGRRIDASNIIGKRLCLGNFGNAVVPVGAVIPFQKRCTYEDLDSWISVILPQSLMPGLWGDILVRIKSNYPGNFIEDMRGKIASDYTLKHLYVTDIERMDDVKAMTDLDENQKIRLRTILCLFLMMNVFLGLLGSFWFRTQQRASEIAIRMVNGATPRRILARVIAEPIVLLALSIPLAVVCVWLMCRYEVIIIPASGAELIWIMSAVGLVTYAEMAVIVVLGVLFPALKAMRTRPAVVLQEE